MDYVYNSISTQLTQLKVGDKEYELISRYVKSAGNHKFKTLKIFKVERKGEGERYASFNKLDNRRLLFHGTSMSNVLGILAQGLRIAPQEAPATGYMFGKGVYLADTFAKSAAYTQGHDTQLMFLCEAALGNML